MKIKNVSNINFLSKKRKKKNPKFNTDISKSIYLPNPKISHTKDFDSFEFANEEELEKYSRRKLSSLLNRIKITLEGGREVDIVDEIQKKLKKGDVDSSNIEMLLELAQDGKLSVLNLFFQYPQTEYNKNFINDLDMIYQAYSEEKSLKEFVVPNYKSDKEAKTKAKIGDVFTIKDDNTIQIKTQKGIKKMFISKNNYLRLFSPLERYASYQYLYGDCYLVSAFDSLFQNPFSRDIILERIAQDKNSKLKISLKGYKRTLFGEVKLKDENDTEIKNVEAKIYKKMKDFPPSPQPKALKLFELLWEEHLANSTIKLIEAQKEKFKKLPADKDYCFIDDFKYTKEEIELFSTLTKNQSLDKLKYKYSNLLSIDLFELNFIFKAGALNNFLDILKQLKSEDIDKDNPLASLDKDELKYFILTLERNLELAQRKGLKEVRYSGLVTYGIFCYLCQIKNKGNFSSYIDIPSSANIVFKNMGLKTKPISLDNKNYLAKALLHDKNFSKKYSACASLEDEEKSDNEFLQNYHSYSLAKEDGRILIRNPINTSRERSYTTEEFIKKFSYLHLAKIN